MTPLDEARHRLRYERDLLKYRVEEADGALDRLAEQEANVSLARWRYWRLWWHGQVDRLCDRLGLEAADGHS